MYAIEPARERGRLVLLLLVSRGGRVMVSGSSWWVDELTRWQVVNLASGWAVIVGEGWD